MNGLLSDSTRDLIAIVCLVLTMLQTIVLVVQLWRSRQTSLVPSQASSSPTQFSLSIDMSDFGLRLSLSAITVGMLLNLITTTGFYLGGFSGYEESRAWALIFPGIMLQGSGMMLFSIGLADAIKGANRRQVTALLLLYACLTILYFVLVLYILPWGYSRWLDLFKMEQGWTLGLIGIGMAVGLGGSLLEYFSDFFA